MASDAEQTAQPGRRKGRWRKLLWIVPSLFLIAAVVLVTWGLSLYQNATDDSDLDLQLFADRIAHESAVHYVDGTPLGVLHGGRHGQRLPPEELPPSWVVSIVAAEDGHFWRHPGFDVRGIARAVRENTQAGRVVAGGSTLTQQTVKNLRQSPARDLSDKGEELVGALYLERHFSKSEVLATYASLFHVVGTGEGLVVAARHFFDKTPDELTLAESAFIAGMVKAPARFDPFDDDPVEAAEGRQRAEERTRYVLERIVELPTRMLVPTESRIGRGISEQEVTGMQAEARRLLAGPISLAFQQGQFRPRPNALIEEVDRRLASPPFVSEEGLGVWDMLDVPDVRRAGLQVVITVDERAQRIARHGLRHHLTELQLQMAASDLTDVVRDEERADQPLEVQPLDMVLGEVVGPAEGGIEVDIGPQTCVVDREALDRIGRAWRQGRSGSWGAGPSSAARATLAKALQPGALVHVSLRADGTTCDLELPGEVNGAVVLRDGPLLRAMVGGFSDENYNRARAPRQFGSVWKMLVIHAAFMEGWNPLAPVPNTPLTLRYSTTEWTPRADHQGPARVSVGWIGVTSENRAAAWLFSHLLAQADTSRVTRLAQELELWQGRDEPLRDYARRLQDAGVELDGAQTHESAFAEIREEVAMNPELLSDPDDAIFLGRIGRGLDPMDGPVETWNSVLARKGRCVRAYRELQAWLIDPADTPSDLSPLSWRVSGGELQLACSASVPMGYRAFAEPREEDSGRVQRVDRQVAVGLMVEQGRLRLQPLSEVRVAGLHMTTLEEVQRLVHRRVRAWKREGGHLARSSVVVDNPSFRQRLAMRYIVQLAGQYGVERELPEVLSLPLGAADISLEEATSMYSGLISGSAVRGVGRVYLPDGREQTVPLGHGDVLIQEIRDASGRLLYRAEPEMRRVASTETADMTSSVLANVVRHGTARRARGALKTASGAAVPFGGKTGTTNEFRNAAFLGYLPAPQDAGWSAADGLVLGVYVGFDDNRPMKRGGIRILGGRTPLSAWTDIGRGLQQAGLLGEPASEAALAGVLIPPSGAQQVPVSYAGFPAGEGAERSMWVPSRFVRSSSAWDGWDWGLGAWGEGAPDARFVDEEGNSRDLYEDLRIPRATSSDRLPALEDTDVAPGAQEERERPREPREADRPERQPAPTTRPPASASPERPPVILPQDPPTGRERREKRRASRKEAPVESERRDAGSGGVDVRDVPPP